MRGAGVACVKERWAEDVAEKTARKRAEAGRENGRLGNDAQNPSLALGIADGGRRWPLALHSGDAELLHRWPTGDGLGGATRGGNGALVGNEKQARNAGDRFWRRPVTGMGKR